MIPHYRCGELIGVSMVLLARCLVRERRGRSPQVPREKTREAKEGPGEARSEGTGECAGTADHSFLHVFSYSAVLQYANAPRSIRARDGTWAPRRMSFDPPPCNVNSGVGVSCFSPLRAGLRSSGHAPLSMRKCQLHRQDGMPVMKLSLSGHHQDVSVAQMATKPWRLSGRSVPNLEASRSPQRE